jgi:hypothetical protein
MTESSERFDAEIGRMIQLMRLILKHKKLDDAERSRRQAILDDLLLALDQWDRLDLPIEPMSRQELLQYEKDLIEAKDRFLAAFARCCSEFLNNVKPDGYNGDQA